MRDMQEVIVASEGPRTWGPGTRAGTATLDNEAAAEMTASAISSIGHVSGSKLPKKELGANHGAPLSFGR